VLKGRYWATWAGLMLALIVMTALAGCHIPLVGTTGSTTATSTPGGAACPSETQVAVNGVQTVKFCGPAMAQANFRGQTLSWTNGKCLTQTGSAFFTVNIGQEAVDGVAADIKKFDYFGIDVINPKGDGVYQQVIVTGSYHGQLFTLTNDSVTLAGNQATPGKLGSQTTGSFKGTDIVTQTAVTGSFSCS